MLKDIYDRGHASHGSGDLHCPQRIKVIWSVVLDGNQLTKCPGFDHKGFMLIGRSPSRDMFRGYFGWSDTKISIDEHSHYMAMSDVDGCIETGQPCRCFTCRLPGHISGCQIPAKLLRGNWTQDKGDFPPKLLNAGV